MECKKFNILALDGGGIRGLYTSYILEKIEQSFNIKLNEFFDLLIGTSTGSIIASAIALNTPIIEVSKLYESRGKEIFRKRKIHCWGLLGLWNSKYNNKSFKKVLEEIFPTKTLKEIDKPLMIVSSDILNHNVYIHKSSYLSKIEPYTRDGDTKLTDAILSSCAAPTYFDPVRLHNGYFLADGGLWANNPSILGLTEAISKFKRNVNEVYVLSIGTGNKIISYNKTRRSWGFFTGWQRSKLIDYIMNISSQAGTNISNLLLKENYCRINSDIHHALDDVSNLDNLKSYADKSFLDNKSKIENFLNNIRS